MTDVMLVCPARSKATGVFTHKPRSLRWHQIYWPNSAHMRIWMPAGTAYTYFCAFYELQLETKR